jgi:AraC-like DNA-binding protein
MAESAALTFSDPDGYAAGFDDIRINLTITGSGDFKARLTRLKLQHLEIHRCYESLRRIAYISLPPEQIFVSFPVGMAASLISDGSALRNGDFVLHSRGERTIQRSNGACQWGLISLRPEQLAICGQALTGRPIASRRASAILRPSRAEALRFQRLFAQACRLAEARHKLIELPEVARALEQEMLHAIINCLAANEASGSLNKRWHHAAIMIRFEEALNKRVDQKISMPALCTEIGVPERTLRMCCAEFLGVSPTRYLLLRRLNKVRWALRRADPSTASVAEIARSYQFLELGRFAVSYRTTFGELPSTTLQRSPQTHRQAAESA